jgi:hypothetical protein
MRLTRFHVTDYRSIHELTLEDIPDVVVLYGNNDAGKSNVLEAIGTWFSTVRRLLSDGRLSRDKQTELSDSALREALGPKSGSMFRHGQIQCIVGGTVEIDEGTWSAQFHYLRLDEGVLVTVAEIAFNGRVGAAPDAALPGPAVDRLRNHSWLCISARRRLDIEFLPTGASENGSGPVDPDAADLKLRLFRAARGTNPAGRRLFKDRVVPIVTGPPLNLPAPDPRVGSEGELALYLDEHPLEERGSGLQQWVILSSLLALSEADIAAIEEPEAHLSWEAQAQVAGALRGLVERKDTPSWQLFVETHSPWMAHAST